MATIFNESSVAPEPASNGAARQRLLTDERVKGTRILLDRLTLEAGSEFKLAVPAHSVAWLQILDGDVALAHAGARQTLTDAHVVFLPPDATCHFVVHTMRRPALWRNPQRRPRSTRTLPRTPCRCG